MSPLRVYGQRMDEMCPDTFKITFTDSYLARLTKDIYIFQNRLLNCPDFSNLGRHDIIPELGVLPHHIRSGLARKICVTQGGVYYGK